MSSTPRAARTAAATAGAAAQHPRAPARGAAAATARQGPPVRPPPPAQLLPLVRAAGKILKRDEPEQAPGQQPHKPELLCRPAQVRRCSDSAADSCPSAAATAPAAVEPADTCAICLCELSEGQGASGEAPAALFVTRCGHKFHFKCIRRCILNKSTSCPMCRRDFGTMTPPLLRPRPRGRSIATLVERNVATVCSGVPLLEHGRTEQDAAAGGARVRGLLAVDETGRIWARPPGGFSVEDLDRMHTLTNLHVTMPPSSFWAIGQSVRQLIFDPRSLRGLNEMQREVLESTALALKERGVT